MYEYRQLIYPEGIIMCEWTAAYRFDMIKWSPGMARTDDSYYVKSCEQVSDTAATQVFLEAVTLMKLGYHDYSMTATHNCTPTIESFHRCYTEM